MVHSGLGSAGWGGGLFLGGSPCALSLRGNLTEEEEEEEEEEHALPCLALGLDFELNLTDSYAKHRRTTQPPFMPMSTTPDYLDLPPERTQCHHSLSPLHVRPLRRSLDLVCTCRLSELTPVC